MIFVTIYHINWHNPNIKKMAMYHYLSPSVTGRHSYVYEWYPNFMKLFFDFTYSLNKH